MAMPAIHPMATSTQREVVLRHRTPAAMKMKAVVIITLIVQHGRRMGIVIVITMQILWKCIVQIVVGIAIIIDVVERGGGG